MKILKGNSCTLCTPWQQSCLAGISAFALSSPDDREAHDLRSSSHVSPHYLSLDDQAPWAR